jgi:hypothetical protein
VGYQLPLAGRLSGCMVGSLEPPLQGGVLGCLQKGKRSATGPLLTCIQVFFGKDAEAVLKLFSSKPVGNVDTSTYFLCSRHESLKS